MDLEVRAVAGMQTCYASLPLSLIHTLESTSRGRLPPILALELRDLAAGGHRWHVAWSGSASRSPAIEVAQQLAECISLPDHAKVQVRAVANIPKAEFVTIEPSTEDDWEIIELNSKLAEEATLKQVGIVHKGMRFPLWLLGHTAVRFLVISTSPENSVVQLVPGTEVSVAPKMRRNHLNEYQDVKKQNLKGEQHTIKALLRVQAEHDPDVQVFEFGGSELGIVLTSAAFVNQFTARKFSLDNLQLVRVFPRLLPQSMHNGKDNSQRKGGNIPGTEENAGSWSTGTQVYKHAVLHILFSESVAQGHIILPHALRLFLKAEIHSFIYVKTHYISSRKDVSSFRLSPCRFKVIENSNRLNVLNSRTNCKKRSMIARSNLFLNASKADWTAHEKVLTYLSRGVGPDIDEEAAIEFPGTQDTNFLLRCWLIGQLKAIASYTDGMEVTSLVLSKETLLHFELRDQNSRNKAVIQLKADDNAEERSFDREPATDVLYLLVADFEDSPQVNSSNYYELALNTQSKAVNDLRDFPVAQKKLEFGEPVSLDSVEENIVGRRYPTSSSLSWLEASISDASDRLAVLLSPCYRKLLGTLDLPLPGHVLIHGPAGSGKSTVAMAVSKFLEERGDILAHIVTISCSKLESEKSHMIRQTIARFISEALTHSPSIIILDDLDHIVSHSAESEGPQTSRTTADLATYLINIMDEYREQFQSCGYGHIAFLATALALERLPQSLTAAGRFDFHVQLPAPAASERGAILKHELDKRALCCCQDVLSDIASKCEGYDAYDLEVLVDRAVHAAVGRQTTSVAIKGENTKPSLIKGDFSKAMLDFAPVSMRGLTKAAGDGGCSGWEDVGGLHNIRNAIQEMINLPSKFPDIFSQSPLRMRSNVLLFGPPGCGKTHIVGAAAVACSLRFISVKGPELLNKYIGASEQAVRDLFAKAASAAPCLLFFDEFDSIAPKRGHDNTGVTDRVVNQLLTELDGIEALQGVFVFAATSRPDLLDAALLRPGRLDRLLFCDFPSWHERLDILNVLSRKLPLANDVDLETIASMTEGFSGADLQALLSDAQLASVHELLDSGKITKSEKTPVITGKLLKSIASKTRPSVPESEKRRLGAIYNQFLDAKKSVMGQSREAKGKRATLA